MKTGARIVLTALFTGAGVFFAAVAVGGYALYKQTDNAFRQVHDLAHSRGREVGLALANMAGEVAKDKGYVSLTSTFQEVVRQSRSQNQDFQIDEIMIVDADGKLRAHNDVVKLAKDSQTKEYEKKEYKEILSAARRDPVTEDSLPVPEDPARPYDKYLAKIFPGIANERLHLAVAIFAVDADFATAGVHLFVTIKTVPRILDSVRDSALWILAVASGTSLLVTFFLVIALYFIAVRPAARSSGAAPVGRLPQGIEFLEAEHKAPAGVAQSPAHGVVLDAIPLDPRRDI